MLRIYKNTLKMSIVEISRSHIGYERKIEQDNCYDRNPFESLAISYRNLSGWGYK